MSPGDKYPGRLGDSPVIGAGSYADHRFGAAACTGHGELTIRAGTARAVVLYLKMGMTLEEACAEALDDLRALHRDFQGGVTLQAIDAAGKPHVTAIGLGGGLTYWLWQDGMAAAEERSITPENWCESGSYPCIPREPHPLLSAPARQRSTVSTSASHSAALASLGMRQSPRGDNATEPTLGPSGIAERLNCWLKKRR